MLSRCEDAEIGGCLMLRILLAALAGWLAASGEASAAISYFPTSVFQSNATGANNLIGNTAASARVQRNQTIGLVYGTDITGQRVTFNISTVTNNTTYVWVRFGRWNGSSFTSALASGLTAPNGAPTSNLYQLLTGAGPYTLLTDAFATACASIGGCNALVFGNSTFSAVGSQFRITSLVASTPEPSAWALMILGFGAMAWRLRAHRRAAPLSASVWRPLLD